MVTWRCNGDFDPTFIERDGEIDVGFIFILLALDYNLHI